MESPPRWVLVTVIVAPFAAIGLIWLIIWLMGQ